jgi:hypothetical protein
MVPPVRPDSSTEREPPGDRAAVATYVAALSADLAVIARRHNLATLGYLLDMARLEAENIAQVERA